MIQDLIKIDTSNGNETKVAEYVKAIFDKTGASSAGQLRARVFAEHFGPGAYR